MKMMHSQSDSVQSAEIKFLGAKTDIIKIDANKFAWLMQKIKENEIKPAILRYNEAGVAIISAL
jgi:hypothetical protein